MLKWVRNDYSRHISAPPAEVTTSSEASHSSGTPSTPPPPQLQRRERHRRVSRPSTTTAEGVPRESSSNLVTNAHKLEYIRNIIGGGEGRTPFWPYASGAGFAYRATPQYGSGGAGQSVVTGEFSAQTSSDTGTIPRYADEEDVSRNTTVADWEDSDMVAQKTDSVADTIVGSYPESGFDSVVGSELESDAGSQYGGDSSKGQSSASGQRHSFAALFLFIGTTFAVAVAFGLAAFFYSSSELSHRSSPEGRDIGPYEGGEDPVVFHAAGNVPARKKKTTPAGEAAAAAAVQRPSNVLLKNADSGGAAFEEHIDRPMLGDEETSKTSTEKPRRRKKIAVWEGKRIYNSRGNGQNASTANPVDTAPRETQARDVVPSSTKGNQPRATASLIDDEGPKAATTRKAARRTARRAIVTTAKRRTRAAVTLGGPNRRFCETKVCERESVYLTSYLDWSVSPCDDFYSFVCNHWKNLHPEVGSSVDSLLVQKVEEDIYHAMTSQSRANNRLIKIQSLIHACVHKPFTESHKTALVDFMGDLGLRGWPFQRDTKTLIDVWKSTSLLLRNLGLAVLVSVKVEPDPENEDRYVIALGDPDVLIGQYGSQESALPEWYSMAVTSCFKVFTSGKYVDIARRVREFSARLAEATTDRGSEAFAANRFKLVQLKHHANLIQLLTFVFSNITVVHSRMKVLVKTEKYFRDLRTVLHVTKGVDVLNYLGFRALLHISPLLPDQALEMASLQMKQLTGLRQLNWPRWRRCIRMFERVTPAVFLHAYADVRQNVPNKDKVWSLLNDIQASFVLAINSAPWMSIDDKLMLRDRLSRIKIEVFHKFVAKRGHKHSPAEFVPDVQPGNVITVYRTLARQLMERRLTRIKLHRDPTVTRWKGSVFDMVPKFDRDSESIFVPMGMFDPTYMNDPESMLLQIPRVATKVIGALFAGIHYGNFPPGKMHWSVDTELGYHDVQKCLQRHYAAADANAASSLPGGVRLRTEKTTQFDVLESLSLLPAFKLFLKHVNKVNIEDYGLLTGLNTTVKQLFYILYTKGLCETTDANRWRELAEESLFRPPSDRANGPLRNSFRFPTFWECASDSPMNPNQKCTIWTS
ncbi:neprilysin-like [Dermacentor albipictus]|uniref:neprilysin-like n=1 Tax=Dermacentor albipictus TaxID=60249 RepID=UPI0038FC943D